jgi:hypothetical protein
LPFFQPSSRTGLTEKIVAGVADYLSGKTDKDIREAENNILCASFGEARGGSAWRLLY